MRNVDWGPGSEESGRGTFYVRMVTTIVVMPSTESIVLRVRQLVPIDNGPGSHVRRNSAALQS